MNLSTTGIAGIGNKMGSREKILENILLSRTKAAPLPVLQQNTAGAGDQTQRFISVIESIGGKVIEVENWSLVHEYVMTGYPQAKRIISTIPELPWFVPPASADPHSFEDVDLAILKGHFGVAENGAVWITDTLMGDRSIPFIAQHLALVVKRIDIVPTLPQAYEIIDSMQYNFGTFIAGPSKTADIEQSLVLGAHGPKSMVVFLLA